MILFIILIKTFTEKISNYSQKFPRTLVAKPCPSPKVTDTKRLSHSANTPVCTSETKSMPNIEV